MEIRTVDGKVINEHGQVAVKYFQPIDQFLRMNGKTYHFKTMKSLSIAWIDAEDVDAVLAVIKECCGGNRNRVFRLEHETHVKRWLNLIE